MSKQRKHHDTLHATMASSSSSFSPPSNVNHTKNNDLRRQDDIAIDFQKLRKEEKKRAIREKKKRQEMMIVEPPPPPPSEVVVPPSSPSERATITHTTRSTNTISPPSVGAPALNNNNKDWPKDWLSSSSSSLHVSTSFTPDYICTKPDTVTYKRDFLSTKQCHELRDWLLSLPSSSSSSNDTTKQRGEEAAWNTMTFAKRRVLLLDGDASPLPLPFQQLSQLLVRLHIFPSSHPPNHVLVNEYTDNQGIMAHTDGPLYYLKTATLSIGNSVLLYFKKRLTTHEIGQVENPVERQVLLESGSLVVFEKDAYTNYCHGIDDAVLVEYASPVCLNAPPETRVTRGHRISLTFRHKYNTCK
jgi:alkylated DNA repair dioxygenase AlkB